MQRPRNTYIALTGFRQTGTVRNVAYRREAAIWRLSTGALRRRRRKVSGLRVSSEGLTDTQFRMCVGVRTVHFCGCAACTWPQMDRCSARVQP
jgi:hypothetical protein